MINVNDLVYCRNSGLQVLTINSHTHTTLSLFGFVVFFHFIVCFFLHGFFFSHVKKVWEVLTFQKMIFVFPWYLLLYS